MKSRNPLAVWLGLPIITGGIYTIYWFYKIHREMADFDSRQEIKPGAVLAAFLLLSWTIVAPFVSLHRTGQRIREAQRAAGMEQTCNPLTGTLLCLLGGFGAYYYQAELNKVVDVYNVEPGTEVALRA